MIRPSFQQAVQSTGVRTALADFDPRIAGTPPLGFDLASSDIDVLCHAPDSLAFTAVVWSSFRSEAQFAIHQWMSSGRPVIASFLALGWRFEIFGAAQPVVDQAGWRHFTVEQRLLRLGGSRLRAEVMKLRLAGAKTEPAFATAMNLCGDPYQRLLELASYADHALLEVLEHAGYSPQP